MDKHRHMPPWLRRLPPDHPDMLDWRVGKLEDTQADHDERLSALETARATLASLPWGHILPTILILLGLAINAKPELIAELRASRTEQRASR